jgi:hypothetical protein
MPIRMSALTKRPMYGFSMRDSPFSQHFPIIILQARKEDKSTLNVDQASEVSKVRYPLALESNVELILPSVQQ